MDYKARHGKPLTWTHDIFEAARGADPFDKFCPTYLREIIAPDGATVFLLMHGYMDETKEIIVSYAIEAPPSCPMRQKFSVGDLSWPDFWEHKGWLLRFSRDFSESPIRAEFITPSQMDNRMLNTLDDLGDTSPLEIKLQQLEGAIGFAISAGRDSAQAEREYREFLMRHANKLMRKVV